MKKGLIIILLALFAMSNVNAQVSVGGGGLLFSDATALELKADFAVSDQISISPFFDYFMLDKAIWGDNVSLTMFGADGHYSLGDREAFDYYPILGINYFRVSFSDGENSLSVGSEAGLTAGFGSTYALSENLKLFGEAKYIRSAFGLAAGIMFTFN